MTSFAKAHDIGAEQDDMADAGKPEPAGGRLQQMLEAAYGRLFRLIAATGLGPSFIVTLEVKGRRSGRRNSTVLILGRNEGREYAVSVLGDNCDWVRNVRAAGKGVIRHGKRRRVRLEEVPVDERAPVLKAYLKWSLGARPLFEVSHSAPVQDFEPIAAKHPVFRIVEV